MSDIWYEKVERRNAEGLYTPEEYERAVGDLRHAFHFAVVSATCRLASQMPYCGDGDALDECAKLTEVWGWRLMAEAIGLAETGAATLMRSAIEVRAAAERESLNRT
jgi:hypothetical protein